MCNHDYRQRYVLLDTLEFFLELAARDWIKRAKWLIHQYHFWPCRQSSRYSYALLLTTRKLRWTAIAIFIEGKPYHLHAFFTARPDITCRPLQQPRNGSDILGYGSMWK